MRKGEKGKGNLVPESIETALNTGHACFARFLFATRSYLPAVRVQKSSLEESVGRLGPASRSAVSCTAFQTLGMTSADRRHRQEFLGRLEREENPPLSEAHQAREETCLRS